MKYWESILISPNTPIMKAIEIIESNASQIALVVDKERKLLGTIADGDVRRAILKQVSLEGPVENIMFREPTIANEHDTREMILSLMRKKKLRHIPVVDDSGRVVDLKVVLDLVRLGLIDIPVVLMAGGLGERLRPLTYNYPKPLLKVGDKPVIALILESLIDSGFQRFYISINYKAKMIEDYFGDGSKWGVEVSYLREKQRLGTAGALRLLPSLPDITMLVMNADLLTNLNYQHFLTFHYDSASKGSMAVREQEVQIPYGVVKINDEYLVELKEKPTFKYFVNAGIYALQTDIIRLIPENQYFDMTDLFKKMLKNKISVSTYPVREYWRDIGKVEDLEMANNDFYDILRKT